MASTNTRRPGVLVVNPSLHDPTPENAAIFLRWTKLHFRDLLNHLQTDEDGSVTRTLRFTAADSKDKDKYAHIKEKESMYFYTILSTHIPVFQIPAYYAVSRRLDLENTRDLENGEEKVGCNDGMMVWDVCDAKFTVYEEVETSEEEGVAAYGGHDGTQGKGWLVGVATSASDVSTVKEMRTGLVDYLTTHASVSPKLFSTIYRNAGADAQPNMHPTISKELVGGGEWLILLLVVDVKEDVLRGAGVESIVDRWADDVKVKGLELKYGVWRNEIDLS